MPRWSMDAANGRHQAEPFEDRGQTSRTAAPTAHLSTAKRRIAEALAALLAAHYRRQHEHPGGAPARLPDA